MNMKQMKFPGRPEATLQLSHVIILFLIFEHRFEQYNISGTTLHNKEYKGCTSLKPILISLLDQKWITKTHSLCIFTRMNTSTWNRLCSKSNISKLVVICSVFGKTSSLLLCNLYSVLERNVDELQARSFKTLVIYRMLGII